MRNILTITTALCLVAGVAHAHQTVQPAQPTAPTYTYAPTAKNVVKPTATSTSNPTLTANPVAKSGPSRSSAVTGDVTVNNTTGGGAPSFAPRARDNTPDAIAPSIAGGSICGVGGSAALSLAGIGLGGGVMAEGENCVRRQNAALLYNMGASGAAKALLCQDTVFSNAFAQAGQPCAADVARWQAAGYRPDPRNPGYWVR